MDVVGNGVDPAVRRAVALNGAGTAPGAFTQDADAFVRQKKAEEKETAGDQESMNPEQLAKLLTNPEVLNMLKVISKSLGT